MLSGGLSLSAIIAIQHFVSASFDGYRESFSQLLRKTRDWHVDLVDGCDGAVDLDEGSEGHFVMAYVPGLAAKLGSRIDFLAEILRETGCIIVSGFHSAFPERRGFCFRINLARDSEAFRDALGSVVKCPPGFTGAPAYITQNGWAVNLLTETGVPGRGWMDWVRIWVPAFNQGAVFSPDGSTVQFDSGKIWQRDLGEPPPDGAHVAKRNPASAQPGPDLG